MQFFLAGPLVGASKICFHGLIKLGGEPKMITTIQIEQIEVGRRLRDISEAQVVRLAKSIGDVGLLNPITVCEQKLISYGRPVDGYELVAGAHRVEACKRVGMTTIPAHVVALSDLERQIAECDENLHGPSLTRSESCRFLRRRKEAYEALHPETRREASLKRGADCPSRQVGETGKADRFTKDTAAKTGLSERSIQRAVEHGTKIADEALAALHRTKLDTVTYLDKLKEVPKPDQIGKVKHDLAANAAGKPSPEKMVAALISAWNKADRPAREEFLRRVNISIFNKPRGEVA
ncbi:ParB/RepB/Spo0J family partition protein [Rhizobium ruizarguesonis]